MSSSKSNSPWPNYRSPHRRRADLAAHAEGAAVPPVVEHAMVPAADPMVVDTPAGLDALITTLRQAGQFGYDTEFIGEQTYYLRFCLIQVATSEGLWLIDPLVEAMDLTPFWKLLADPAVEVIVHAGLQDLEPVHRLSGRVPQAIFDTQVAAAFIGQAYPISLVNLCRELAEADLGASSKFSQWDRRPLSEVQKTYAANDVRYLPLLRERIGQGLEQRGHRDMALAECAAFSDPSTYRVDPLEMKLKARGAGGLNRQQQAVLNALLLWRAQEARCRDVPVRALVDDQVLTDLARQPVESVAQLKRIKGLPRPVKETYAATLLELTEAALAGPLPQRRKSFKPLSEQARAILDALWPAVLEHCQQRDIAPSIVLTKREVTALIRATIKGKTPRSRLLTGWREELLRPVLDKHLAQTAER